MKVWEICNQVKGTAATKEQIALWAYMNRICPVMFWDGLELGKDEKLPREMIDVANKLCKENKCGTECLDKFLESEVQP